MQRQACRLNPGKALLVIFLIIGITLPMGFAQDVGAAAPEPVVKDAAYWVDQGGLAATYGAYDSAIKYYKKALAMGFEKSQVYFNMGISYGELGEYPLAMAYLDKAIHLNPDNGTYYYGRGRVYLLSGDKDMAMADFEHAVEIGSKDAQRYLEGAQ